MSCLNIKEHKNLGECTKLYAFFTFRTISTRIYQTMGKMADSETLTLCISLNSSQMCTYFYKDLVTRRVLLSVPGKNSIANRHPFSN